MAKTSAHEIIAAELTVPDVSALVDAEFDAAKEMAMLSAAD
jgi:hypothetical protein